MPRNSRAGLSRGPYEGFRNRRRFSIYLTFARWCAVTLRSFEEDFQGGNAHLFHVGRVQERVVRDFKTQISAFGTFSFFSLVLLPSCDSSLILLMGTTFIFTFKKKKEKRTIHSLRVMFPSFTPTDATTTIHYLTIIIILWWVR